MNPTPATLYKLIILFFLDSVEFPISNAIISDYILDRGYTDYFRIQRTFKELEESSLISSASTHKTTYYSITEDGRKTLDCFHHEISLDIKTDIKLYLNEHFSEIIELLSVKSDYTRVRSNEYLVSCSLNERGTPLASIGLTVSNEESAQRVCRNWTDKNSEIYSYLIKKLMN